MPISKIKGSAINDDAITSARLDDGTIVAVDLASNAVTTVKIQDDAVTEAKIGDGEVSLAKLSATGTKDSTTFLRGDNTFQEVSVTPTAVSDQSNTSTGAFDIPSGTTAERPGSPNVGYIRYNTDDGLLEIYDGTEWVAVSVTPATLSSVTGSIYAGIVGSDLTLTGTGFLDANLVVNFSQSSDGINEDVTVTPASDTSASVAVPSAVYNNVTAGNVVTITVTNSDGQTSGGIDKTAVALPSGGTITTSGDYRIHTFTSSSSLVVPSGFSTDAEYVVVAGGGGGGGDSGGGGGAGGYRSSVTGESSGGGASAESKLSISSGSYTVTIGAGGSGSSNTPNGGVPKGSNGQNSVFGSITSIGGGGGGPGQGRGSSDGGGLSGGSGGGGGSAYPTNGTQGSGGSGTSGQGYAGAPGNSGASPERGGGGGGAGGLGTVESDGGGDGGIGVQSSINGSATYRAGGGGGGAYSSASGLGQGGQGGGGNGSTVNVNNTAQSGTANTGGGGGSATEAGIGTGGNGGSGVVIVRYDTTAV